MKTAKELADAMDARRWNEGPIIIGWQSMPLAKLEAAFVECQRDALETAERIVELAKDDGHGMNWILAHIRKLKP